MKKLKASYKIKCRAYIKEIEMSCNCDECDCGTLCTCCKKHNISHERGKFDSTNIQESTTLFPGSIAFSLSKEPFVCPVCNGSQKIERSFYGDRDSSAGEKINCRTCLGLGIVWG